MTGNQDYVKLAGIIQHMREQFPGQENESKWLKVTCDIANWCTESIPEFNRPQFLRACGVTNEEGQRK